MLYAFYLPSYRRDAFEALYRMVVRILLELYAICDVSAIQRRVALPSASVLYVPVCMTDD
jgi:hypothetical protein